MLDTKNKVFFRNIELYDIRADKFSLSDHGHSIHFDIRVYYCNVYVDNFGLPLTFVFQA